MIGLRELLQIFVILLALFVLIPLLGSWISGNEGIPNLIKTALGSLKAESEKAAEVRDCYEEDLEIDEPWDNRELIGSLAREKGIPEDLMLRTIDFESLRKFKHCTDEKTVLLSFDGSSVGLGQIEVKRGAESTAATICGDLDVYALRDNAQCSIDVMWIKYQTCGLNEEAYRNAIIGTEEKRGLCTNPAYQEHYLSYTGEDKAWHRALRCYNGLGCIPPSADVCYVEHVRGEDCPIED